MFFHQTAQLVLRYAQASEQHPGFGFNADIAFELLSRVRQLDWLYGQIVELERSYWVMEEQRHGSHPSNTNWVNVFFPSNDLKDDLSVEERLRVLVECFYYVAHRLLVIFDQCSTSLPGLGTLRATAIRRVRNNLIEHANRPGGRVLYSFSISNAAGVRLRSLGKVGEPETFLDNGIHANAVGLQNFKTLLDFFGPRHPWIRRNHCFA
jgi:hypothetical protein